MHERERQIARVALDIGAVTFDFENPAEWASGYRMPIYNDTRMFLFNPENRRIIVDGFRDAIFDRFNDVPYLVIAGVATGGISWGAILAEELKIRNVYVRDKPKNHGKRNRIEGIGAERDLRGYNVVLFEDVISTGESSANAVQAVRDAKGVCNHCISVFSYGFDRAQHEFHDLRPECYVTSLLTYDTLRSVIRETGYLNDELTKKRVEWEADPFGWGEKHGFPKVEKK